MGIKDNLSVLMIVKNEEQKIFDAINSILWVDEIIVLDTGSTDKTLDIVKKFSKVKHIKSKNKNGNFSDWRNEVLSYANNDWVFYLDADERIDLNLKKEIIEIIQNNYIKSANYYAVPRKNMILGKELKHGGQYPDYVKRLFLKNDLIKWHGDLHEEPVLKNPKIGHLKNSLLHLKHDNFEEMIIKTNKWSEIEAKLMFEAKHPKMNLVRFFTGSSREFYLRMIKQKAFLDGKVGFLYAMYQVFSRFTSYAKLWEMQEMSK